MDSYNETKQAYEKRHHPVKTRYTKKEYELLKLKAEEVNLSVTTYVKKMSLGDNNFVNKQSKLTLETKSQIRKIGVNINQIAHRVNAKLEKKDIDFLQKNLDKATHALKSILKTLQ